MKKETIFLGVGIGLLVVSGVMLTLYIVKNKKKKEDEK